MIKTMTKEKRRFLLFLPLVVIPFLCLVFRALGGGHGTAKSKTTDSLGLNTQLPALTVDLRKAFQDKLKTYEQADVDSMRKAQYQRQDPYRRDSLGGERRALAPVKITGGGLSADARAEQLERQLVRLQQSVRPPATVPNRAPAVPDLRAPVLNELRSQDPQLDRLNVLLDKVIRIQHPQETVPAAAPASARPAEVVPADSGANSIAAVVPEGQTLVTGETIALRIADPIRVAGRVVPAGALVYGTVQINGDRMLVHVGALRRDRSLYSTDWQVYDLDGLAGIHIPGMLGREVVKQSADQGIGGLNLLTLDPSLGAQAAGAGIQAAKSFLGHKVRQVRVTVRAGYQVLLRVAGPAGAESRRSPAAAVGKDSLVEAPDWEGDGPVLARSRNEGMEVALRMVCIHDSCLWFGLEWANRSPIVYTAAYVRWTIRDRRVFRRTALQEQPLEPVSGEAPADIGGDSVQHSLTGFRPFALSKDKELRVEIGEKGGGRALALIITHKQILKAKHDAKASQ